MGRHDRAFTITSGLIVPIAEVDLHAAGHKAIGGIGDIGIQPALFGWHDASRTLFVNFGPNLYVPSGRYDASRLANTGRNTVVFWPTLSATWLIGKRFELSVGNTWEISTVNPATHYHSGADYTLDWEATAQPFTALRHLHLGVNGYAYKQFSDDAVRGAIVNGGNRGQVFSIGPVARLDLHRSGIVLRWDHEFAAENRPRGERVWLQFTIPLSRQTAPTRPAEPPVEK